jgi:tRNA modification GTPase
MPSDRQDRDTIFAQASAPGRAGVAIVRLSGPLVREALVQLTRSALPSPRTLHVRQLLDARGAPIDRALVAFFAAPASYTGEDVGEFQIHGGSAVAAALFAELARQGLRPAEPGEFTRRAVENGKLDLTEAEAIADLVNAETEAQRRQALQQYEGDLSKIYEGWRARIVRCSALVEAALDFTDEELPEDLPAKARAEAKALAGEFARHLDDGRRGELTRDGLHLTVIGPPNAGKSSLINALAKRDVAIVAETAGTTRDVIEVRLDLGGYPVIVADTAGLRAASEAVEAEGVRRALARAEQADLVLLLLDGSVGEGDVSRETIGQADLVVWNKADLPWQDSRRGLHLSLKTGDGLLDVIEAIANKVRERLKLPREGAPITRARHRRAIEQGLAALLREASLPELFAEDLRLAARALGRITGRVDIEEVLDSIFREFCIGK